LWLLIGMGIAMRPVFAQAEDNTIVDVCADRGTHVVVEVQFREGNSTGAEVIEVPTQRVLKVFDKPSVLGAAQRWVGPKVDRQACYRVEGHGIAVTAFVSSDHLVGAAVLGGISSEVIRLLRFPKFSPWPPPEPTSRRVIPRALVTGRTAVGTWGEVADRFDNALDRVGYTDLSYYAVPNGFAVATRVERIESDGAPAPETARWADVEEQRQWTLETLLRELVGAPIGHYRTIVFVFSPDAFQLSGERITEAQAEKWRTGGVDRLPASLRGIAYGNDFRCDALVYEFQKRDKGHPAVFIPGGLSAEIHLSRSRILEALGQLP
jgi:hypothetical protein